MVGEFELSSDAETNSLAEFTNVCPDDSDGGIVRSVDCDAVCTTLLVIDDEAVPMTDTVRASVWDEDRDGAIDFDAELDCESLCEEIADWDGHADDDTDQQDDDVGASDAD